MGNLCDLVNENLRDCPGKTCKGIQLQLELDRRIEVASCWKLTCSSCAKVQTSTQIKLIISNEIEMFPPIKMRDADIKMKLVD